MSPPPSLPRGVPDAQGFWTRRVPVVKRRGRPGPRPDRRRRRSGPSGILDTPCTCGQAAGPTRTTTRQALSIYYRRWSKHEDRSTRQSLRVRLLFRVVMEETEHLLGGVRTFGIGVGPLGVAARPVVAELLDDPFLHDHAPFRVLV